MRVSPIRKAHRWLGLIAGLQLMAWTVSGLYFAWQPIGEVRGNHLMRPPELLSTTLPPLVSPDQAAARASALLPGVEQFDAFNLRLLMGEPVYELAYRLHGHHRRYLLIDAQTGEVRPAIGQAEAEAIARAAFLPEVPIASSVRLEEVAPGSEYREGDLPAWQIRFDHPSQMSLYVSEERGRVTAARTRDWRIFDFLWMLHIMDYQERDNFNTRLLQGFALLGVVTVASGFLLWGVTTPLFRRRKNPPSPAG
jgi:uncharacterized iron-regulated membrane protein